MSYTKLFAELVDSSIWCEDDTTRLLWITLLAMADKNGEVMASVPGLAKAANIPIHDCERGLNKLQKPDKHSRSKVEDGRRIVEIPGGFEIVNYMEYRNKGSKEDQKTKNALRQKRWRDRRQSNGKPPDRNAKTVTNNGSVTQDRDIAEAEADAEADAERSAPPPTVPVPPLIAQAPKSPKHKILWTLDDGFSGIHQSDLDAWSDAYPACDIDGQLKRMNQWLLSNPRKAKKSNWRAFVTNWLTRKQDQGGDIGSNKSKPFKEEKPKSELQAKML